MWAGQIHCYTSTHGSHLAGMEYFGVMVQYHTMGTGSKATSKMQDASRNSWNCHARSCNLSIQVQIVQVHLYHDYTCYMYMYTLSVYRCPECFQVQPNVRIWFPHTYILTLSTRKVPLLMWLLVRFMLWTTVIMVPSLMLILFIN